MEKVHAYLSFILIIKVLIFLQGDSGGGLVARNKANEYVIVGIVSWRHIPCAGGGTPDVFTKVSFFIDWINDTMKNN